MKPTLTMTLSVALITFVCFYGLNAVVNYPSTSALLGTTYANTAGKNEMNWTVTAVSVTPSENLVDFHRLDGGFGKALGARGTIFETTDAGRSWRRLPGGLANPVLARIWFVNKKLGWATVIRQSSHTKRKEYDAFLMRTEDGGSAWTVQHTVKNGSLNQLSFANEQEGWAVGSTRHLADEQATEKIVVLHTVDGGQNWRDLSQSFDSEINDLGEDILSETSGKATFLTNDGSIFATEDGGNSWRNFKTPEREQPQLANLSVLKDEGHRLWVLSSTNSRELTRTRLAHLGDDGRWSIIHLPDLYISDIRFLSANEIVACGSVGQDKSLRLFENREGVVIFSADGGKTWRTIYRTQTTPRINVLTVFHENRVLALSDKGWAFSLYRPSN